MSCDVLFRFFKAGSEWWENSTPSGLVVVTQPKKVTGPHYDPVAFVDAFEILPLVGNLWLDYVNQGGLREELGR